MMEARHRLMNMMKTGASFKHDEHERVRLVDTMRISTTSERTRSAFAERSGHYNIRNRIYYASTRSSCRRDAATSEHGVFPSEVQ